MVPSGRRALRRRTLRPSVDKRGMMRPQQLVTLVALCGTVALVGSGTLRFGFDSPAIENTATPITDPDATRSVISLSAEIRPLDASPATATDSLGQAATSDPNSTEPAVISAGAPAASVSAEVFAPRHVVGGCTGLSRRVGGARSGHDRTCRRPRECSRCRDARRRGPLPRLSSDTAAGKTRTARVGVPV